MIKAYYNLDEKQAKAIYLRASKKVGNTTTAILQLLESRVRTAVFRAGFVVSFLAAKQLISHGHFLLNGRTITISSINLRPGDKLELKESSPIRKLLTENVQVIKRADSAHLEVDKEKFVITYKHHPASTDEIPWENPLDIIAFIEYYSR
jgi:small subunit ribosomal protein S4